MKKAVLILVLLYPALHFTQRKKWDTLDYKPDTAAIRAKKELLISSIRKNSIFFSNNYDKKYLLIGDFRPVSGNENRSLAKVRTKNGYGFINKKGEEVIPAIYKGASSFYFKNGMITVQYTQKAENPAENDIQCSGILNYKGELLTPKCSDHFIDFTRNIDKHKFNIIEDTPYIIYGTINNFGIISNENKIMVPMKYASVSYSKGYFIAHLPDEKNIDIYDEKGTLLRRIEGRLCSHLKDQYFSALDPKTLNFYLIDITTSEKVFNHWDSYTIPRDSKKVLFAVEKATNKRDQFSQNCIYFIDHDLKIINKDFPNAENFHDLYLVNISFENNHDCYNIVDFKGKLITTYSDDEYQRYKYFVPYYLHDPDYINEQNLRIPKFEDIKIITSEMPDDIGLFYDQPTGSRSERKFKRINAFNKKTFDIFLSLDSEKYSGIRSMTGDTVAVYNKELKRTEIYDLKGRMMYHFPYENWQNEKAYFQTTTRNETYNLIDKKTLQNLFNKEYHWIKPIDKSNLYIVKNGSDYGVLDSKDNLIKPFIYRSIFSFKQNLYLFKQDSFEIYNPVTKETLLQICLTYENEVYGNFSEGFYYDSEILFDLYGNASYHLLYETIYVPKP